MSEENRIIALETKIAYQEDVLQTLNDIIVDQQQRILNLEQGLKGLITRAAARDTYNDPSNEEIPPHY